MWNGKNKAVTFSFDDGVLQDIRTIEILDKYGLKGTFNLNTAAFGSNFPCVMADGRKIQRMHIKPSQLKEIYKNHEVAVHTLSHFNLCDLDEESIVWQVEEDRKNLERFVGYPVRCMAYPCGGVNNDERVAKIIKEKTKIEFARTITSSESFDMQENLYQFNPTFVCVGNYERMLQLAKEFIELQTTEPKILYLWGHSYEFDMDNVNFEMFEEFCKLISGKEDIFYGTNGEVLLNNKNY